jgi:magnesium-protoporphyrin IX monomethyl ester (oxidative) cyclase
MRYHSTDRVLDEIRYLYHTYGANLILPEDDLFTANKVRTLELLNGIAGLNLPDFEMQFPNALSVNTLNEEVIDGLIRAGMKICVLAIESGSELIQRKVINKRVNLEKAKQLVGMLRDKGIYSRCYFIIGFPGETIEQMHETINYARDLGADWCSISKACPLPGTQMYDDFIAQGSITDDENIPLFLSDATRLFDTPVISAADLNELSYRANLDINFINNVNFKLGDFLKAKTLFEDVTLQYPFHIVAHYCISECHANMGEKDQAASVLTHIANLIATNSEAKKMFNKYHHLMPKFALYIAA